MNSGKERQPPIDNELYLRHLTIEEAHLKLDKYLDDAFMSGLLVVRIVHGKGAGILRNFVHRELKKHSEYDCRSNPGRTKAKNSRC